MSKREIISSFLRKVKFDSGILVDIIEKTFSFLSEEELYYTLNPSFGSIFTPFVFKDMRKVAETVIDNLFKNKGILIFGDKDADGMIGTFILKDFLEKFKLMINSRSEIFFELPEGDDVYGIVPEVVDRYADKVSLIITVDNGISAVDALKRALERNIKVIITDHHELHNNQILELATAIVNPKVERKYGVYLSGAGVVFFVILGILLYFFYKNIYLVSFFETDASDKFEVLEISDFYPSFSLVSRDNLENFVLGLKERNLIFIDKKHYSAFKKYLNNVLKSSDTKVFLFESIINSLGFEYKFDEMVDKLGLMPSKKRSEKLFSLILYSHLFGKKEIKDIVYDYIPLVGITVLSDSMPFLSYNKFFILEAVKRLPKVKFDSVRYILSYTAGDSITYRDISMKVIPFINSAGRMGKASKMVELLLSENVKEIEKRTKEISILNDTRKKIVDEYIKSIFLKVKKDRVIVDEKIDRGLISLISTKIANQVEYPVIVMSNGGNGEFFSGSARFRNGNIFEIIKSLSHYLENFGGHRKAAGFVISKSRISEFVKEFLSLDYEKFVDTYNPILKVDLLEFKKMAGFFYYLEPLNDDFKPVLEDEVILQDYKIENYTKQCYVMIKNEWFPIVYESDKMIELIGEKVRVIFSYEYKYDNKLQEILFIPKILEIRKC